MRQLCGVMVLFASLFVCSACAAQDLDFDVQANLIPGSPQAIYETNPGGTASVTIDCGGTGSATNITGTYRWKQVILTVQCKLETMPLSAGGPVSVLLGDVKSVMHEDFMAPGETWFLGPLGATNTGNVPIDHYRARGSAIIEDGKTGDDKESDPEDVRDVTVRALA